MKDAPNRKRISEVKSSKRASIIAVSVAALIVCAVLFILLGLPILNAHAVFSRALREMDAIDGQVVLCDPYVKTELYPETREVSLSGEEASEISEGLLFAFSACRYKNAETLSGGTMLPYLCVKNDTSAVYFYLEEDYVLVRKNSTYYRFAPKGSEGEAAYAELYALITERLSEVGAE